MRILIDQEAVLDRAILGSVSLMLRLVCALNWGL